MDYHLLLQMFPFVMTLWNDIGEKHPCVVHVTVDRASSHLQQRPVLVYSTVNKQKII